MVQRIVMGSRREGSGTVEYMYIPRAETAVHDLTIKYMNTSRWLN